MQIGFIGLGHMGQAMASVLIRAGHMLIVYNRTRAKADDLEKMGARVARSPEEAARGAEVLMTMLADDQAVESLLFGERGAIAGLRIDGIHASMSTISPALARRLARAHRDAGQHYISAPVLGRPEAAERGELMILAAGPSDVLSYCQPIFEALGKKTHVVGLAPEMANVAKLGANVILATLLEVLGEAYALVERYGIDDDVFLAILNGLFKSPVIESYGKRIADEQFEPAGFRLRLGLKDVRLALDAGESVAVPMPVASVVRERFVAAIARGMQDADWSAVARAIDGRSAA